MPTNDLELLKDFTGAMGEICHGYCSWIAKTCSARVCLDCPLEHFKEELKRYCERMEDDGR